jgi:adenine deaminase
LVVNNTAELVDVALGISSPDLLIKGGNLVNVLTHEIYPADVWIKGPRIAAVTSAAESNAESSTGPDYPVIDAAGQFLVPGFIDPHVHIESSAVTVQEFARVVVPKGVTGVAEDPHEIANVLGLAGIRLFFEEALTVPLNLFLRVPGRVPGMPPHLETSGGSISLAETKQLLKWDQAVCLAGDINPNIILSKDPIHAKKIAYTIKLRKTVSGQSPGLKGNALNAFVASGPEDSHVSENVEEVLDIMRHGMRALITHRPHFFTANDYKDLARVIRANQLDTRLLLLCTDDIQPHILMQNGHLDERLRIAIQQGIDPLTVIQMATINVADYFRIDRDYGSLAPGKFADIVILDRLETIQVDKVIVHGKLAAEKGALVERPPRFNYPGWSKATIHLPRPVMSEDLMLKVPLEYSSVDVRVIIPGMPKRETSAVLPVKDGIVMPDPSRDILCIAVIDRHSNNAGIGRGFVTGFGIRDGAVASTVSHDAHNIFLVGSSYSDMALAANRLVELGGGHVAVKAGQVIAQVPLPIAGLMSDLPVEAVGSEFERFELVLIRDLSCAIQPHPLYDMNFLCLPNIPHLGITDKGLVDSDRMEIIDAVIGPVSLNV